MRVHDWPGVLLAVVFASGWAGSSRAIVTRHDVDPREFVAGAERYTGASYAVERVIQHPGWTGDFEALHDIALIELRSAVADPKPAKLYRGTDELGQEVLLVGRGMSGTGLTGPVVDDQVLRAATNTVTLIGDGYIGFEFDAPGSAGVTQLEGISGPGDSGGAAHVVVDGELFVAGVSSAPDDARPGDVKEGMGCRSTTPGFQGSWGGSRS